MIYASSLDVRDNASELPENAKRCLRDVGEYVKDTANASLLTERKTHFQAWRILGGKASPGEQFCGVLQYGRVHSG